MDGGSPRQDEIQFTAEEVDRTVRSLHIGIGQCVAVSTPNNRLLVSLAESTGVVTFFNSEKGFGAIAGDQTFSFMRDSLVNINESNMKQMFVSFSISSQGARPCARNIHRAGYITAWDGHRGTIYLEDPNANIYFRLNMSDPSVAPLPSVGAVVTFEKCISNHRIAATSVAVAQETGIVLRFNPEGSFGFLRSGNVDLFFHAQHFSKDVPNPPKIGLFLGFERRTGRGTHDRAVNLRLAGHVVTLDSAKGFGFIRPAPPKTPRPSTVANDPSFCLCEDPQCSLQHKIVKVEGEPTSSNMLEQTRGKSRAMENENVDLKVCRYFPRCKYNKACVHGHLIARRTSQPPADHDDCTDELAQSLGETKECCRCQEPVAPSKYSACKLGHVICEECLAEYASEVEVNDNWELPCPFQTAEDDAITCPSTITEKEVLHHLKVADAVEYTRKVERRKAAKIADAAIAKLKVQIQQQNDAREVKIQGMMEKIEQLKTEKNSELAKKEQERARLENELEEAEEQYESEKRCAELQLRQQQNDALRNMIDGLLKTYAGSVANDTSQVNECLPHVVLPLFERAIQAHGKYQSVQDASIDGACKIGFHGNDDLSACRNILCKGLDPSRRSVQAYGPGEYFDITCDISRTFAKSTGAVIVFLIFNPKGSTYVTRAQYSGTPRCIYVVNNPPLSSGMSYCLPIGVIGAVPLPPCPNPAHLQPASLPVPQPAPTRFTKVCFKNGNGNWVRMDDASARLIIAAVSAHHPSVSYAVNGNNYTIDLTKTPLMQQNTSTKVEREITLKVVVCSPRAVSTLPPPALWCGVSLFVLGFSVFVWWMKATFAFL